MSKKTYILVKCKCGKCKRLYKNWIDKSAPEDEVPPCTYCHPPPPIAAVTRMNIGTNKGKAIDYVQKYAEQQFGMTDMRDNLREGDIAAKLTPAQSKIADEMKLMQKAVNDPLSLTTTQREMARTFWGGTGQGSAFSLPNANQLLAGAKAGARAANAEGLNPLTMLHSGLKAQRKARGAA